MDPATFRDLYAYNEWAYRRVWTCLEQLSDEHFTHDLGYSHGSLREQCLHTLGTTSWWFRFLQEGTIPFLEREHLDTRPAIRAAWDDIAQTVRTYLAEVTEVELRREVRPDFWDAHERPITVWQALLQVANHSTDHRAQMLVGIQRLGGPTVEQDYLRYLFSQQSAG